VNRELIGTGIEFRLGAGGSYAFHFRDTKARLEDLTDEPLDKLSVAQVVALGKQAYAEW
jgi:hypothetical protein